MSSSPQNGRALEMQTGFVPFAYGFRPFFLVAGWYAMLIIAEWLWVYSAGEPIFGSYPPQLWHGHEMVYGFVGAAIAGFMLTAVPSWTSEKGFAGTPLIILSALWLLGRIAFATASWIPLWALAAGDLVFLPALAFVIARPLLRQRNRNTPLLFVLLTLWATDVAFIFFLSRLNVFSASTALLTAINIVLLLVTVIGGRIVPAFTASALRRRNVAAKIHDRPWLDRFVIGTMVLAIIVDIVTPRMGASAIVAAVAAVGHAWRLAGWQTARTLSEPIVWVLHLAYAWLPIGLLLKAVHISSGADWAAHWLHALTMGAAATMILAVMSRAALGHTGRPLVVAPPTTLAYVLLTIGTIIRVFVPATEIASYASIIMTAGIFWVAAFALFVTVYTPILVRPRVDGRPG